MIACEQKLPPVKKYNVTARMSGRRNRKQVVVDLYRFFAYESILDLQSFRSVVRMHRSAST
jgi:hypothetical protein